MRLVFFLLSSVADLFNVLKWEHAIVGTTAFMWSCFVSHCLEIKRNSTNLMRMWSRFVFFLSLDSWIVLSFFFSISLNAFAFVPQKASFGRLIVKKKLDVYSIKKKNMEKVFYLYRLCSIASNIHVVICQVRSISVIESDSNTKYVREKT